MAENEPWPRGQEQQTGGLAFNAFHMIAAMNPATKSATSARRTKAIRDQSGEGVWLAEVVEGVAGGDECERAR